MKSNALDAITVRALVAKGVKARHADGNGLYLHVTGEGAAKWSLRYMLAGKAREMGLGRWADDPKKGATLAMARAKAIAMRAKLNAEIDPLAEKRAANEARKAEEAARLMMELATGPARTFKAAFDAWLETHGPAMRTERQRKLARAMMENHVLPRIGAIPVADVTTADMLLVLQPLWRKRPETALRVRIRCDGVFAWAKANGWRSGDNPAAWKDNLAPLLGRHGDVARVKHHAALHWRKLPSFMRRLELESSMSSLALRWAIHTAARTAEVIGATWAEIDMQAEGGPVWIIPAARMKMGAEHRVPLSAPALAVLEAVEPFRDDDTPHGGFLFPGGAGSRGGAVAGGRAGAEGGGLSNMAMLQLLRSMGMASECTVHGFRSTFRDWVEETTGTPHAVAEAALAHAVGNEVTRSYQRGDLLEKRRVLMRAWGEYCERAPASVASIETARARKAST